MVYTILNNIGFPDEVLVVFNQIAVVCTAEEL